MPFFTRFFGRTVGEGAGVAIGTATAKVVEPALQDLANNAWEHDPHVPLDPEVAAALVARETLPGYPGIDLEGVDPEHEAKYSGVRPRRFAMLRALAREHPTVGQLLRLRQRRLALGGDHGISQEEYREWMRRQGFTTEVIDSITKLLTDYLAPADVANAVQQGFVPGDGLLPPPETGDPPYEPPVEVVDIDPVGEVGTSGIDRERLKVLAELSGNPPGPQELLEMWRRGIITEVAVERGIREGRTKTKWTPALKRLRNVLLNPATLVNLFLRGWIPRNEYHERMSLHGFTAGQADDWYDSAGRPAAPVQMFNAWARGIDGPDGVPMNEAQFLKGIRESDIRPEWGEMLWGLRHAYPSLFQLRRAVQDGAITRARALTILHYERYEDADAEGLVESWLRGAGTTAKGLTASDLATEYEGMFLTRAQYIAGLKEIGYSQENAEAKADAEDAKRVRTARNQAIARIHAQYVNHKVSRDQAVAALANENVPARARNLILPEWDNERAINVARLTPAQVKRAYKDGIFTLAQAVAELEERGYSTTDANILLGVPPRRLTAAQIARAYRLGLLSFEDALADLRGLGYSDADAQLVLGEALPTLTVSQIQEAYREQIMTYDQALAALRRLGYSAADATVLLEETGVRLTAAQVKRAFGEGIFTREQAIQRLLDLGYDEADANIYLDE